MDKAMRLVLVLTLIAVLLCGCSSLIPDQTILCGDLTITLPGQFLDLSDQDYAEGLEMVYGLGNTAVSASKEPIESLAVYIPDIDAQQYAQLVIDSYGLASEVETVDGIPSFTYTMDGDGTEFTYLVGVFASDTDFWMVQCYCPSGEYSENQEAMWGYITSVTIN